jgi:hypothetical protein
LSRLATRDGASRRLFRSAGYSGAAVALSTALLVGLLGFGSASDVTDVLALRALAYASWLFGGLGLWVFCAPDRRDSTRLAAERGFSGTDVARAWFLGVSSRIAVGVFLVTLVPLALSIALSQTPSLLASRLLLVPGIALYAVVFGISMALLGRLAIGASPRSPRLLVAIIVLLPFVASLWFRDVPSIPGAFGFMIRRLIDVGGFGL